MQGLDDPAWLRPDGERFQPQDYTLVFETGDQPYDSVILIHQKEVADYFKFAFSIRLVPPEGLRRAVAKQVQQARTVLQKRTEVFQKATASECWGVRQVVVADVLQPVLLESTKVGELIPCETNSAPVSDVAVVE